MAEHKKELLLVGGHVASGKTWYCEELAREEGTVFVKYDSFFDRTQEEHGVHNLDEWLMWMWKHSRRL